VRIFKITCSCAWYTRSTAAGHVHATPTTEPTQFSPCETLTALHHDCNCLMLCCSTVNSLYRNPLTRIMMGVQFALQRRGPMTMPPSTLGCFARSSPARTHANIEWHVQPLSLPAFGQPLHPFDAITPSVCNLKPSSRGSVRITSPAASVAPAIQPNYLSTEEDKQVSVAGRRLSPHVTRHRLHAKAW
jgi:choline dehydrogenase-like flavoprotein